MECSDKQILIIGAADRSGTTLLQRCLNNSDSIDAIPQAYFLQDVANLYTSLCTYKRRANLQSGEIDRAISKLISGLLTAESRKSNAKYIADKTPRNILSFNVLNEIVPDAKFLFMIRNPVAVINSIMGVRERIINTDGYAGGYLRSFRSICEYVEKCNSIGLSQVMIHQNVGLVQYERLVKNPDAELASICKFLEIPYSISMMPGVSSDTIINPLVHIDDIWYGEADYNRTITDTTKNENFTYLSKYQKYYIFRRLGSSEVYGAFNYFKAPQSECFYCKLSFKVDTGFSKAITQARILLSKSKTMKLFINKISR